MGRGCAQLGKAVKGRSQAGTTGATDAPPTLTQQIQHDIQQVDQQEQQQQLQQYQQHTLSTQNLQEEVFSTTTQLQVLSDLRQHQRQQREQQRLKDEEYRIQQQQILEEWQKQTGIQAASSAEHTAHQLQHHTTTYLQQLERLRALHDQRCQEMEQLYTEQMEVLVDSEEQQLADLIRSQTESVRLAEREIAELQQSSQSKLHDLHIQYETEREELRNKNLESINELRIHLEARIEELESEFEEQHHQYVNSTSVMKEQYQKLKTADMVYSEQLEEKQQKLQRLETLIKQWKTKLHSQQQEHSERNSAIQQQKQLLVQQCQLLKQKLLQKKKQADIRLVELTSLGRDVQHATSEKIAAAERILSAAELVRKYETEREKLGILQERNGEEEKEDPTADKQQAGESYNELNEFYRKYNKVLLDTIAIRQERQRLAEENRQLKYQLQQRIEGASISAGTVKLDATLLAVNQRPAGEVLATTMRRQYREDDNAAMQVTARRVATNQLAQTKKQQTQKQYEYAMTGMQQLQVG